MVIFSMLLMMTEIILMKNSLLGLHLLSFSIMKVESCMPYVLTCQHALCAYVLTCQRALHAHVPTCLVCLRAHVITCSLANMPCVLCMPMCSRTITTNDKDKFSITCFPYIFLIVLCLFPVK